MEQNRRNAKYLFFLLNNITIHNIISIALNYTECFKRLQKLRTQNPDLKILLSIEYNDKIIDLCENDSKRAKLEDDVVEYVYDHELNGIDLDYPLDIYTVILMQIKLFESNYVFWFISFSKPTPPW